MDGTKRSRHWQAWQAHITLYPGSSGLQATTDQLLTFAVAVQEGQYGLGAQVKAQLVEGLSGMLPKASFLTDIETQDKPPRPNNPLTSPSHDC